MQTCSTAHGVTPSPFPRRSSSPPRRRAPRSPGSPTSQPRLVAHLQRHLKRHFRLYIPGIPFANFIGSQRILSLQKSSTSSRYRTNLGIVEGSGEPASLLVRMFAESGQSLGQFPLRLNGGQHGQLIA